LANKNHP